LEPDLTTGSVFDPSAQIPARWSQIVPTPVRDPEDSGRSRGYYTTGDGSGAGSGSRGSSGSGGSGGRGTSSRAGSDPPRGSESGSKSDSRADSRPDSKPDSSRPQYDDILRDEVSDLVILYSW